MGLRMTALPFSLESAPPSVLRASRSVALRCDDLAAGQAFAHLLLAEGLAVQVRIADDAAPPLADAVVLHVSGQLTEQLARLRSLRAQSPALPLMVAVRGLRDLDQVLALEMGADDAIDAALAGAVVAARLRALWRRAALAQAGEPADHLCFGSLALLRLQRQARLAEQLVPLTEGEFEVLWLLASRAGQAVSRHEILRRVRGLEDHPMDRSIDSRVYRIRAKLGDAGPGGRRIRTVRNHGYAFSPQGW